MNLGVDPLARLVDQLHGVATVAMHESVAIWDTSVTHEDHDLVNRLWVLREVVPEGSRVIGMREMCRRVSLLSVNEVRELGRVSQEEDWCVVCHMIPVALLGSELDGESSGVASAVVRARFATNG